MVGEAGFESSGARHDVNGSDQLASPCDDETDARVAAKCANVRPLTKLVTKLDPASWPTM